MSQSVRLAEHSSLPGSIPRQGADELSKVAVHENGAYLRRSPHREVLQSRLEAPRDLHSSKHSSSVQFSDPMFPRVSDSASKLGNDDVPYYAGPKRNKQTDDDALVTRQYNPFFVQTDNKFDVSTNERSRHPAALMQSTFPLETLSLSEKFTRSIIGQEPDLKIFEARPLDKTLSDLWSLGALNSGKFSRPHPTGEGNQKRMRRLCDDIYAKLGTGSHVRSWVVESDDLSNLLRVFANRISPVSFDFGQIVYSHHRDIVDLLKAMYSRSAEHAHDDLQRVYEESNRQTTPVDSHVQIVSKWKGNPWELPTFDNTTQPGEGRKSTDQHSKSTESYELDSRVLESHAYKLFIAQLWRESMYKWPSGYPRVMIDDVRGEILRHIVIRPRRKFLANDRVVFTLHLHKALLIPRRRMFGLPRTAKLKLKSHIIITGTPEHAQALSIEQYLAQTWPEIGADVVKAIERSLFAEGDFARLITPGNPIIDFDSWSREITLILPNVAYVVDYGEQLAWLEAALSGAHDVLNCRKPSIRYVTLPRPRFEVGSKSGAATFHESTCVGSDCQNGWHDLVGQRAFVLGYPILPRPQNFAGLEVSYEVLLRLLDVAEPILEGEMVFLRGPSASLQLARHSEGIFLWHRVRLSKGNVSNNVHRAIEVEPELKEHFHRLENGRHIVSNDAEYATYVFPATGQGLAEDEDMPATSTALFDLSNNGPKSSHDLQSGLDDGSGPAESSHGSSMGDFTNEPYKTASTLDDMILTSTVSPQEEEQLTEASGSPDSSLDSELLSVSDDPEDALEISNPTSETLKALSHQLLREFHATTRTRASSHDKSSSYITITSRNESQSSQADKRRLKDFEEELDSDDDGSSKNSKGKIQCDHEREPKRIFACPYFKKDPGKYYKCCAYRISRPRDVKLHLRRIHYSPQYCQRCFTISRDEQSHRLHISEMKCQYKDPALQEDISHEQDNMLHRRCPKNLSEYDQWFTIWEIVFPGLPRPKSPYLDPRWTMEQQALREYFLVHGPVAIRRTIYSDPSSLNSEVTEEHRSTCLDRLIREGIEAMFEDWYRNVSQQPSIEGSMPASTQPSICTPVPQSSTHTASVTDSGVVLSDGSSSGEATGLGKNFYQVSSSAVPEFQGLLTVDPLHLSHTTDTTAAGSSQDHRNAPLDDIFTEFWQDEEGYGSLTGNVPYTASPPIGPSDLFTTDQVLNFEALYPYDRSGLVDAMADEASNQDTSKGKSRA